MSDPQYLYDAYISYADDDKPLRDYVRRLFEHIGIKVAPDRSENLRRFETDQNVWASVSIVYLLTPSAKKSPDVLADLLAMRNNKLNQVNFCINTVWAGTVVDSVPYGLMSGQFFKLQPQSKTALDRLLSAVIANAANYRGQKEIAIPDNYILPPVLPFLIPKSDEQQVIQKYDLYLSYRRVDKDQMVVLRAALEKSGLSVWSDDILPKGGDWRTAIEQAIEQSRVVVTQLSSSITEYTWIVEDIAYAQGHNIPIFPIALDKSPYGPHTPYNLMGIMITDWWLELPDEVRQCNLSSLISALHDKLHRPEIQTAPPISQVVPVTPTVLTSPPVTPTLAKSLSGKAYDVFISYKRGDTALMEQTYMALCAAKLNVWTDQGIEPGTENWKDAIENALRSTATVVALLSPEAKQSKWVGNELTLAESLNVRIYPVWIHGDKLEDAIPFGLLEMQIIDARQDFPAKLQTLVEAVTKYCVGDKAKAGNP